MRGPQPTPIELDPVVREGLELIRGRHSSPQQQVVRAKVVLLAAQGKNNRQIARELNVSIDTARLWRGRWLELEALSLDDLDVMERLADGPRPGKPPRLTAEQVCQIVALGCEKPEESRRPISQWSGREIADEVVRRGIVETISARHVRRLLKRGACNPAVSATG
ncbi:MAG TPA: helix-turn-helix domain-containing protein [Candidatus Tectomicrobia bacterium]